MEWTRAPGNEKRAGVPHRQGQDRAGQGRLLEFVQQDEKSSGSTESGGQCGRAAYGPYGLLTTPLVPSGFRGAEPWMEGASAE